MSVLKTILQQRIADNGPLNIAEYMSLALSHPEHGYYIKQDPFGKTGDFITAPEISQLFGEIIGIWCIQQWVRMGAPSPIALAEGGPGRGTLMADLTRGAKAMEEFLYATETHLIETSPVLRSIQKQKLGDDVTWHNDLSTLPPMPLFFIANELLDALPIRQFIKQNGTWLERVVTVANDDVTMDNRTIADPPIPDHLINADDGAIYEHCPLAHIMMKQLCDHIKNHGGVALFIDYGHLDDQCGDTFQAVKNHQYCDVTDYIGDADLTAHVNFASLAKTVSENGLQTTFMTQREFLLHNGIEIRARQLLQNANENQTDAINNALDRLLSDKQMGTLFKVMVIHA